MARGLLVAGFDFSTAHADEFHDWYDLEHLPERRAVPGFGGCQRWLGDDNGSHSIATYDLDSVAVLDSPGYRAIAYANLSPWSKRVTAMCTRLIRFEGVFLGGGEQAAPDNAGGMLINAMNVEPAAEKEFNAWYDEEHIPALAAVPGTLSARRYRAAAGRTSTHDYVAVYHLETPDIVRGGAWKEAVETPWTLAVRPHFRNRLRVLTKAYRRDD